MRRTRLLVGLAVIALAAAACGNDDDSASDTTTAATETTAAATETTAAATETTAATEAMAAAGAQTYTVSVDAKNESFPIAALAYFPKALTAHPGDTVNFTSVFSGEPHTVTFGTLVDQGLAKFTPPTDPTAQAVEPDELKKIPPLLPDGPGDAIQASAQPCFLPSGDPPASDACSKDQQTQPDFDGTYTYYNSGFLGDGDQFTVKLADSLAPGTYSFFCALHRAGMTGSVTVVAPDATADTPDEVAARGKSEVDALVAKLQPAADALKTGAAPGLEITGGTAGQALAGTADPSVQDGLVSAFGPDPIDVKAGESVTWTIIGPHTITFGATEALRTIIARAPDGGVHVNPDSFAPAGGGGQPEGPPPSVPGPPIAIDGGSYDGTGLHSSGAVISFPPQLYSYKLSFTKAGTYPYVCLIHPDMKGTVNVA